MKRFKTPLDMFLFAAKRVPAYRHFLSSKKIDPEKIYKEGDFNKVPIVDKSNYLLAYKPFELVADGVFPYMVSASSGSSGRPYYWPRGEEQEDWGVYMHERIFEDVFDLKGKNVLVVICFSMGNWVAGTFTLASMTGYAKNTKKMNISIITPGIDKNDAINVLRDLAPNFDSVVLVGYPPFIMDIVVGAKNTGIDLSKLDAHFLVAGENFSEKWREEVLRLSGVSNKGNRLVSIYGTADAGSIGHETKLSILVRKLAVENEAFRNLIFPDLSYIPTMVAYYPDHTYFEVVDGHLIFTTNSGIPLVRYNIKDQGDLLNVTDIKHKLAQAGLLDKVPKDLLNKKQSFIILKGRKDVSVTFYALNIYPENLKAGLEDERVCQHVTGKYVVSVTHSKDLLKQKLNVSVELRASLKPDKKMVKLITTALFDNLVALNTEYRKLFHSIKKHAIPKVVLKPHGHDLFVIKKSKHKWVNNN